MTSEGAEAARSRVFRPAWYIRLVPAGVVIPFVIFFLFEVRATPVLAVGLLSGSLVLAWVAARQVAGMYFAIEGEGVHWIGPLPGRQQLRWSDFAGFKVTGHGISRWLEFYRADGTRCALCLLVYDGGTILVHEVGKKIAQRNAG